MKQMFLDIETLPASEEQLPLLKELYDKYRDRRQSFEEYHRETALNGNFGRILCIGYAIDGQSTEVLIGEESQILTNFWQLAANIDQFIGHNALDFDIPFILKRSIINSIKPSREIRLARYQKMPIFDTKREWDNWSSGYGTSLDTLAKIFGYQTSKQGIDGSQVYDFYLADRHQEIYDYCQRDVALTRKIYLKMNFESE